MGKIERAIGKKDINFNRKYLLLKLSEIEKFYFNRLETSWEGYW